jgi:HlyD family secretion protein
MPPPPMMRAIPRRIIAIDELKQQALAVEYKRQAVKTAEAQLQNDQVTLDSQKQQLAYTTVNAPIDGVVSALNIQKGAIVASGTGGFSGGTTILTLSDLSHIFVTATVDESDIGVVQVGQAARITVASFPGRTFAGRVTRIATTGVNTSNVVTFEVKVEVLDEHKDLLRPQMTGNVTIIQAQRNNVLTLPPRPSRCRTERHSSQRRPASSDLSRSGCKARMPSKSY